jgi:hypothetical protein
MPSHKTVLFRSVIAASAAVIAWAAQPNVGFAQDTAKANAIPIQKISTASAVSTEPLGAITSVRELPGGRLLVNDGVRRRLLMMDTTLKVTQVVLDSLTEVANTYGTRAGALIPYRGDSTLFIDPASYAMLVLDANAKIAKVRSVWRTQDLSYVTNNSSFGWPNIDAHGRVVYRIPAQPAPPKVAPPSGVPWFPENPDSSFIVAVNLDTRKVDTLGAIRIPKQDMRVRQTADGFTIDQVVNPLPRTDDWSVLPDGRIAFVRGIDYRVEYFNPDGKWTSSAKLPYDWQRLSDEDKKHVADSAKAALDKQMQTQWVGAVIRWVNMYNGKYPEKFNIPDGFVLPPGFPKDWELPKGVTFPANYIYACAPGETPPAGVGPTSMTMTFNGPPGAAPPLPAGGPPGGTRVTSDGGALPGAMQGALPGGAPGGQRIVSNGSAPICLPAPVTVTGGITPPPPTQRAINVVDPSELPDYKPPMLPGAVRADEDGNLWIRTVPTKPVAGGGVYDIVNKDGELVSKLQMPPGYTIVGFGRNKVVYASMRDAQGIHLARIVLK